MSMPASIFLDFNLPNATTWFYFSLLLAVALFFKFSRLLSVRNWDVLMLFLLVPGLLLLQDAHATLATPPHDSPQIAARVVAAASQALAVPQVGLETLPALTAAASPPRVSAPVALWFGYLWLFC